MFVVPQEPGDAEMLAERIAPRLQHANSAVVLTAVKVIVYLMNYMSKDEDISNMCKKLSPPLGKLISAMLLLSINNVLLRLTPVCRAISQK